MSDFIIQELNRVFQTEVRKRERGVEGDSGTETGSPLEYRRRGLGTRGKETYTRRQTVPI